MFCWTRNSLLSIHISLLVREGHWLYSLQAKLELTGTHRKKDNFTSMFQMQTSTTGIPPRLGSSFYDRLKQEHREAEGCAKLLGEDTCENTALFQAFNVSWTCHGSTSTPCLFMHWQRCAEAAAALSFPATHSRPSLALVLVFVGPHWAAWEINQPKINPKREKLFNFCPV